jgi:glycosyltransferase involved in cell wall biosynthesis
MDGKVGIAISTYNRPQVLSICIEHFKSFCPKSIYIVVVDDNSTHENKIKNIEICEKNAVTYIYNNPRIGIAATKNVCIKELIRNSCDYYFLFDDDCWPISNNWWKPFTRGSQTGNYHLQYVIDGSLNGHLKKVSTINGLEVFNTGWGGCLFFTMKAIDTIGGFGEYGNYGLEHVGTSFRCNKMGLTPNGIFLCPQDAKRYIYSIDLQGVPPKYRNKINFGSSMSLEERKASMEDEKAKAAYDKDLNEKFKQNI